MYADWLFVKPVVRGDWRAHALGAVFRETLDIQAGLESDVRKKKRRCLGALSTSAMPSYLDHVSPVSFLKFKDIF
jgi:hypothetical protein